jgi:hypothetical protein
MSEAYHYSVDQRQAIRDEVFHKLEEGVASIQDSESFAQFLSVQAKFHHYSPYNVALILAQRPDATHVASFRKWEQDFHRRVKKGEKAIRILAPTFGKDEETGEQVLKSFIPVPVFDISSTEGKPLPEPEVPLLLEGSEGGSIFEALMDYAESERVHVRMPRARLELAGANGDYNPRSREIRIAPNPMKQMAKTLAHELSHHVHITQIGAEAEDRGERETVAEGSAYVVMAHFGIDSGQYTFPYVAGWSKNRERLMNQLKVIHQVSERIINALTGASEVEEAAQILGQSQAPQQPEAPRSPRAGNTSKDRFARPPRAFPRQYPH